MHFHHDETSERVGIVGAGPVGLALALILARYQIPTLLLEARPAPTPPDESRAITWMPRGLELLDWLGLTEHFLAHGVKRTHHEFRADGKLLLTLAFDQVRSTHPYTLQLPQHSTETLLEQAAVATGYVELRRQHRVLNVATSDGGATLQIQGPEGSYHLRTAWAVACDGARSTVRDALEIGQSWRDYGMDSAVADFEMSCDLAPTSSVIVLDPTRPYGFFCFAPDRWRFIYRINPGEERSATVTEDAATTLLRAKLPQARIKRFLWASAFRLGQGQSTQYRSGRWLLAGDAAHAMGPSAGAGMMIGLLGVWRLGWRLALAMRGHPDADRLLDDYAREQRAGAEQIQHANAVIFRNMAVRNPWLGRVRAQLLPAIGAIPGLARRMTETEALIRQRLPVAPAVDAPRLGAWPLINRFDGWVRGERAPAANGFLAHVGDKHLLVPLGLAAHEPPQALLSALQQRLPVAAEVWMSSGHQDGARQHRALSRSAVAVVRPDQHVAALYQL